MAGQQTRERILDAAETLFADSGISGTSLRALTRAAGVNLAAVHYHFGSKEGLLDALLERRVEPLNEARLEALGQVEAAGPTGPERVEAILEALLVPSARALESFADRREQLERLMARVEAQPRPLVESLQRKHFGEVARRFVEALQAALPDLPKEVVADRFRFAIGVLFTTFAGSFDLDSIPGHPAHARSYEEKIASAIAFLAAGLRAPAPSSPAIREPNPRARNSEPGEAPPS